MRLIDADKYRWHKYPDEKPTVNKKYLVVQKFDVGFDVRYCYSVLGFAENLKEFNDDFYGFEYIDGFDSNYYNHCGFYDYDDGIYFECSEIVAWMEIPEYKE